MQSLRVTFCRAQPLNEFLVGLNKRMLSFRRAQLRGLIVVCLKVTRRSFIQPFLSLASLIISLR